MAPPVPRFTVTCQWPTKICESDESKLAFLSEVRCTASTGLRVSCRSVPDVAVRASDHWSVKALLCPPSYELPSKNWLSSAEFPGHAVPSGFVSAALRQLSGPGLVTTRSRSFVSG